MTRPVCVVFNPNAARGKAGRRLRQVRQLLGDQADFRASAGPGHCEVLAHQAAGDGFATVVAAGGDGTVHEVANGILRAARPNVALGLIPLGSGNDYARALELPTDLGALCRRLLSGPVRQVDVGEVGDERGRRRFFVNTLGLGLSGAVAVESRQINSLQGLALYSLAVLRALLRHFEAPPSVLTIDGREERLPTLALIIALGPREGGGFIVAPDARLDDGYFDYLHAGRLSRLRALWLLPRLPLGLLPEGDRAIRFGQCRSVRFRSDKPLMTHLDGELFLTGKEGLHGLSVELLPGRLAVKDGPGGIQSPP